MTWAQRQIMKDRKMSRRRKAEYDAMKAEARAMTREEVMALGSRTASAAGAATARARKEA